jgi:hypothetical protein
MMMFAAGAAVLVTLMQLRIESKAASTGISLC